MPEHERGLPDPNEANALRLEPTDQVEPPAQLSQPEARSVEDKYAHMVHTVFDSIARRLSVPESRIDSTWARFLAAHLDRLRSSNHHELQSLLVDFFRQFLNDEQQITQELRKEAEDMEKIRETLSLTPEQVGEDPRHEEIVDNTIYHAVRQELDQIFKDMHDR